MSVRRITARLAGLLAGVLALLTASGCEDGISSYESTAPKITGDLTLTAMDVGKADALVLQTANTVTVIDTGNKGDGKDIEKFLTGQGIEAIDTLIITHFDKDHVGGAARLCKRMKISKIYVPDYVCDSEEYLAFTEKAQESGQEITALPVRGREEWTADDAAFRLYAPNETFYGKNEENDFSLVLYVQHGENSFLFAGDAEDARQNEIIGYGLGKVNFLKFPYHGHYLATTEQFLDECAPDAAVICCSKKEYADDYTVETLQKRGVDAYYTCDGTVTVVCDGRELRISQS